VKTQYSVALAMLAGFGLGVTAIQALHAQAKAPVYYISEINVTDPDSYRKEYAPNAQAIIKAAGGRFVAIGGAGGNGAGKVTGFDGEPPRRVTVQVWDSMEKSKPGGLIQPKLHIERSAKNTQHFAATPSMVSPNNDAFLVSFEAA
jgi:uncharacterized protein (DUF1330 family)